MDLEPFREEEVGIGMGGGSVSCRQSRLLEQVFLLFLIPGKQILLC